MADAFHTVAFPEFINLSASLKRYIPLMSAKRIQLTVPAPCQQRWHDMQPVESGRFCASCQKTVVDFATMTDQQIGAYFSNKPQHVCGRFTASQLNRDVALAQTSPDSVLKQRWLGLMAAVLLGWSTTQGQSTPLPDNNVLISGRAAPELSATVDRNEQPVTPTLDDSTWVITGQVLAKNDKAPLPGVNIIIKGTQRGTTTDASGSFKLNISHYQSDSLTITIGYIGFLTQEIEINASHKTSLIISLVEDSAALEQVVFLGQVVVSRKPSLFKKLRNRFKAGH